MIVDCTDINQITFVQQRLADEGLEFPTKKDLVVTTERFCPRVYNYFSLHGRQLYITLDTRYRRLTYQLVAQNCSPSYFGLDPMQVVSYNRHLDKSVLFSLDDWTFIFAKFKLCVKILLEKDSY